MCKLQRTSLCKYFFAQIPPWLNQLDHQTLAKMVIPIMLTVNQAQASSNLIEQASDAKKTYATPNESITPLKPIEVIGNAPQQDTQSSTTHLKGKDLRRKLGDTLGHTLQEELGVSNASFGPGVGIPVIRGFTGSRVRMLQNGIGTHDASSLSPDHAVTADTILAEEITIIRGPETIRYGSNAIGGIVDVKDYRIPDQAPAKLIKGSVETRYDTNGNGTHSAVKLNLGKDWFAMNLGGFFRQRGDTHIPGKAIDEDYVKQQFGLAQLQNSSGKIPNTDSQGSGGYVGASWLGNNAIAGMSISHSDSRYGVPKGSHHLDPNDLHGLETLLPRIKDLTGFQDILGPQALFPNIRISQRQTRYDFKYEWFEPMPGIESIQFRYGLVDYRHTENEGGLPFTQFKNKVGEGRVELTHRWLKKGTGKIGSQWINRDFSALGVEKFVPETRQDSFGFYSTQDYAWSNWVLKGGLRVEHSQINPKANELALRGSALPPVPLPEELEYRAFSASSALQWNPANNLAITASLNRAKRSPDIQELLSLGPHLSTRSFEIGNVQLKNETVNMADLAFDWKSSHINARINGYYNRTDHFIYLRNTGLFYEIDNEVIRQRCVSDAECVPIYAYNQQHAEFTGFESKIDTTIYQLPTGNKLALSLFSDYVRGQFTEGNRDDVPRMPPLRYGAELSLSNNRWYSAFRFTRAEAQDRPGQNEAPTNGYHLLTLSSDYQLTSSKWGEVWLFAKGYNLLNEEIRNSVSFLRSFSPEPGRSFIFGLRAGF